LHTPGLILHEASALVLQKVYHDTSILSHMMPFFVELEGGHIKEPIWFECDEVELVEAWS